MKSQPHTYLDISPCLLLTFLLPAIFFLSFWGASYFPHCIFIPLLLLHFHCHYNPSSCEYRVTHTLTHTNQLQPCKNSITNKVYTWHHYIHKYDTVFCPVGEESRLAFFFFFSPSGSVSVQTLVWCYSVVNMPCLAYLIREDKDEGDYGMDSVICFFSK